MLVIPDQAPLQITLIVRFVSLDNDKDADPPPKGIGKEVLIKMSLQFSPFASKTLLF